MNSNGMQWVERLKQMDRGSGRGSQGLAGWLLGLLRDRGRTGERRTRHMQVIETLPLAGKRQLMLVDCEGERFLVGGAWDSVQVIVPVRQCAARGVPKSMDGPCL